MDERFTSKRPICNPSDLHTLQWSSSVPLSRSYVASVRVEDISLAADCLKVDGI